MKLTRLALVLAFLIVAAVFNVQKMVTGGTSADDPPVITGGDEILEVSVEDDESVLLTGLSASDRQDGDITGRILVTGVSRLLADNTAKVTCAVFDSDHNMATLTRRIRYTDYRLPRFSLDEPLVYDTSDQLQLLDRLHATDVLDGDITDSIRVNQVDGGSQSGVHAIGVQVTNSMGDTAWLTLPVILVDSTEETIQVDLDTYLVYLKQGDSFDARRFLNGSYWKGDPISNENVTITSNVDTAVPGTYQVEYTCVYGSRTGTVILTVVVE